MIAKIRRFRTLARSERWLLLQAVVMLPVAMAVLRLCGCKRGFALVRRLQAGESVRVPAAEAAVTDSPETQLATARRAARLVETAARYGFRATCLPRALTLSWLLGRRGIPAVVRLGARLEGGKLAAHAWVECRGVALDRQADGFRAFDSAVRAEAVEAAESRGRGSGSRRGDEGEIRNAPAGR